MPGVGGGGIVVPEYVVMIEKGAPEEVPLGYNNKAD
jgi:hypothetical protein